MNNSFSRNFNIDAEDKAHCYLHLTCINFCMDLIDESQIEGEKCLMLEIEDGNKEMSNLKGNEFTMCELKEELKKAFDRFIATINYSNKEKKVVAKCKADIFKDNNFERYINLEIEKGYISFKDGKYKFEKKILDYFRR